MSENTQPVEQQPTQQPEPTITQVVLALNRAEAADLAAYLMRVAMNPPADFTGDNRLVLGPYQLNTHIRLFNPAV